MGLRETALTPVEIGKGRQILPKAVVVGAPCLAWLPLTVQKDDELCRCGEELTVQRQGLLNRLSRGLKRARVIAPAPPAMVEAFAQ